MVQIEKDRVVWDKFLKDLEKRTFTTEQKYKCTDSDNKQYSKRVDKYSYKFKEFQPDYNSGTEDSEGEFYEDIINLYDHSFEEYRNEVIAYYPSIEYLWEDLGEDPEQFLQIVLECMWEQCYMENKY